MKPFSVICPTCEARLKVRHRAAIGQILSCPKCDSMVHVVPPPGWKDLPDEIEAPRPADPAATGEPDMATSSVAQPDSTPAAEAVVFSPLDEPATDTKGGDNETATVADAPAQVGDENASAAAGLPFKWPTAPLEAKARKVIWWSAAGGIAAVVVVAAAGAWLFGGGDDDRVPAQPVIATDAGKGVDQTLSPNEAPNDQPAPPSEAPTEVPNQPPPNAVAANAATPAVHPQNDTPNASGDSTPIETETTTDGPVDEPGPALLALGQPPQSPPSGGAAEPIPPSPGENTTPSENTALGSGALLLGQGAGQGFADPGTDEPAGRTINPSPGDPLSGQDAADAAPESPAPADEPIPDVRRIAGGSETVRWPTSPGDALQTTIPAVRFQDVSLLDLADTFTSVLGSPVSLDLVGLQTMGRDARSRASADLTGATAADVLAAALAPLKLIAVPHQGQILITAADPAAAIEVSFKIDDLAGPDAAGAEDYARLVRSLVAPDSWDSQGGAGKLTAKPGELVATQPRNVQYEILIFLEKLRAARKLPSRSKVSPERFALAPRRAAAAEPLARPVTLMFHEPTTLVDVLRMIEASAGVWTVVDWGSVAHADFTPATLVSCTLDERSTEAALSDLLTPLGLGWLAFDARTIQIVSLDEMQSRQELEFYPAALAAGQTPAALIAELERATGAAVWKSGGGEGLAHYDEPGGCLVVRNTQPVQAAVARWLGQRAK